MALTTVVAKDAEEIFRETCRSFRESLPDFDKGEFKEYQDADSMIAEIQRAAESHPVHKTRLTALVRKLHRFTNKLEPYFEIVNIFVQVEPEYAAIVWGSLRLIFQLLSNYATFLETVSKMFEKISDTLPIYGDFVTRLQARASNRGESYPRLATALSYLYVDTLRFCHDICLLFSQKRNGFRMKASFISRLSWMPIRTQFQTLLSNITDHRELLELEISRASNEEAFAFYDLMEKRMCKDEKNPSPDPPSSPHMAEKETDELRALTRWIEPPVWISAFEQAQDKRAAKTGEWIVETPIFQKWQENANVPQSSLADRMLSVQGKPGFGKTVLCTKIIENLGTYVLDADDRSQELLASVVFYFFDERRGTFNNPYDALRAITMQILSLNRYQDGLLSSLLRDRERSRSGQEIATDRQVLDILAKILPLVGPTFILLDGIDECSSHEELFRTLKKLSTTLERGRRTTRHGWLLCGRPSVVLPKWLSSQCQTLDLHHLMNNIDIGHYLLAEVEDLIDSSLLPADTVAQDLVNQILPRTNGMFLWSKLLIEYLRSPALSFRERKDAILHLNRLEGLDAMYEAILASLSKNSHTSRSRVQSIFHWVAFAHRPMPIPELGVAISIDMGRTHSPEDEIPNFKNNLGALTGSLIECNESGHAQFIHLSTREFFRESDNKTKRKEQANTWQFSDSNMHITSSCISYLYYTVPAEPLSGAANETPDKVIVNQRYPLLGYASTYWGFHFAESAKQFPLSQPSDGIDEDLATLNRLVTSFAKDPLRVTTWIESAWLFSCPLIPDPRLKARSVLKSSILSNRSLAPAAQMIELVYDLSLDVNKLNKEWAHVLQHKPNEIWEPSIATFTNSKFWFKSEDARLVRLAPLKDESKNCMTLQSQISSSGLEVAVVRLILPPGWNHSKVFANLDASTSKWKGRFELWSLATNEALCALEVALPKEKIMSLVSERRIGTHEKIPHPAADTEIRPKMSPSTVDPTPTKSSNNDSTFVSRLAKRFSRLLVPDDPVTTSTSSLYSRDATAEKFSSSKRLDPAEKAMEYTVSVPVAISHSVHRAVILDVVLEVAFLQTSHGTTSANTPTIRSQTLDTSDETYISTYFAFRDDLAITNVTFDTLATIKFSPSDKYLVTIRESLMAANKGVNTFGQIWLMQIYRDENFEFNSGPRYTCIASTIFFAVPEIAILSPARGVAFHPTLPRIVFPQVFLGLAQTYVWDFEEPLMVEQTAGVQSNPFPLHDPPVFDPHFSDDGDYLCGTGAPLEFGFNEEVKYELSIPIATQVPEQLLLQAAHPGRATASLIQLNPYQPKGLSVLTAKELSERPKPHVQRANTLLFEKGKGSVVHVSQLQQLEKHGAVMMRTFGTNGEFEVQTLTRLPMSVKSCADVSIVNSTPPEGAERPKLDSSKVYVVLNKAHRRFYTAADVGDRTLPAVIEREKSTIPTFVRTVNLSSEAKGLESYHSIQRIGWRDDSEIGLNID